VTHWNNILVGHEALLFFEYFSSSRYGEHKKKIIVLTQREKKET